MASSKPRQRGNDIGASGAVVAFNVRRYRRQADLDLRSLSARLDDLGRPISPSGLSKIENLERRVEVDDLVALAIALDVNPNALLFQPTVVGGHYLDVTGASQIDSSEVWAWANGEAPLHPRGMPEHLRGAGLSMKALQEQLGAAWEAEREKFRSRVSPGAPSDPGPGVSRLAPKPGESEVRGHQVSEIFPVERDNDD